MPIGDKLSLFFVELDPLQQIGAALKSASEGLQPPPAINTRVVTRKEHLRYVLAVEIGRPGIPGAIKHRLLKGIAKGRRKITKDARYKSDYGVNKDQGGWFPTSEDIIAD